MIVAGVVVQTLGAAILFPILVSYAYDRLREKWLGDEVWRLFNELAEAGISRVYKDREYVEGRDNALTRLSEEFNGFTDGEVRMIGASLRVFFNPLGPFYRDIDRMMKNPQVTVRALVNRADSPEASNRTRIEEPNLPDGAVPQSRRDLDSTIANVTILHGNNPRIDLRMYAEAPYCTAIIFPDLCYYSPNLIAPEVPVRLPMIVFRSGSHAYKMISASFESIWASDTTVVAPGLSPAPQHLSGEESG